MNLHFTFKIRGFSVANLPNSLLLRAVRRLEPTHFKRKLFRPELIRVSLAFELTGIKTRMRNTAASHWPYSDTKALFRQQNYLR